jgi:hypothetical protein
MARRCTVAGLVNDFSKTPFEHIMHLQSIGMIPRKLLIKVVYATPILLAEVFPTFRHRNMISPYSSPFNKPGQSCTSRQADFQTFSWQMCTFGILARRESGQDVPKAISISGKTAYRIFRTDWYILASFHAVYGVQDEGEITYATRLKILWRWISPRKDEPQHTQKGCWSKTGEAAVVSLTGIWRWKNCIFLGATVQLWKCRVSWLELQRLITADPEMAKLVELRHFSYWGTFAPKVVQWYELYSRGVDAHHGPS